MATLCCASACADRGTGGAPAPEPIAAARDAAVAPASDAAVPLSADAATPAWRAVVERYRVLARRGDRGLVVGRIGATVDGATWLIDETDGDGLLAIRVAPPIAGPAGARAVVAGAWDYHAATQRWIWRAVRATVDAAAPPRAFLHPVGHVVPSVVEAPADAVPASAANCNTTVVFAVVGAPVKVGDGWAIADERRGEHVAWLLLPGEEPAYGGQEMLADDETWKLAVGARYAVDVARIRRPRRALPVLTATGPPRALP